MLTRDSCGVRYWNRGEYKAGMPPLYADMAGHVEILV